MFLLGLLEWYLQRIIFASPCIGLSWPEMFLTHFAQAAILVLVIGTLYGSLLVLLICSLGWLFLLWAYALCAAMSQVSDVGASGTRIFLDVNVFE